MKFSISFYICLFFCVNANALKLTKLTEDQGVIWGFDFISAHQIVFTEREGKLKVLDLKAKKVSTIKEVPEVYEGGQAGLLDVIVDSKFDKNKTLYLTYSKETKTGKTTAIHKAKLKNNSLIEGKDILITKASFGTSHHFGSRVREDKDGYLFVSIGDRGKRDLAQKLEYHNGKILRITKEGKPAPGNPFLKVKNALPEIYSYGHRNPQGMYYDSQSNQLWVNEHGPRGGDEINLVEASKNYGWPVITYGREYYGPKIGEGTHKEGMEQPLYYYVPSIATSGLVRYSGKMFPQWKDNFFSGALKLQHINRLYKDKAGKWKEDRIKEVADLDERIRSVKEGPEGAIYFSTDEGEIYKISK